MGDAVSAHQEALTRGGHPGIRNVELIESAIARPYIGYSRSIAAKAADLAQSISGNHGFIDGNKRTTLILVNLLIRKSGYKFALGVGKRQDDELEWLILAIVEHRLELDELIAWLKRRLVRA